MAGGSVRLRGWRYLFAVVPALGIFTVLYAVTAWQCDDAYITHRSIDNLLAGHGLRWQVAERVQSFTHPLWLFLMLPLRAATGEAYFSTLALSYVISGASVGLLVLLALRGGEGQGSAGRRLGAAYLLAGVAFVSQAFIDYSSSGLENPLSHLLGVLMVAAAMRPGEWAARPVVLTGLMGLAMLNRIDVAVLYAPVVLVSLWPELKPRTVGWCALALGPLIAWTGFSIFYYGFPVPNTAYAKAISADIPSSVGFLNAWAYFRATLVGDPVTLLAIWGICVAALVSGSKREKAIALGLVLYQLYLFRVGGDFMQGRFFSTPFFVALALAASFAEGRTKKAAMVYLFVLLLGTLAMGAPFERWDTRFGTGPRNPLVFVDAGGITDERAYYYPVTGMLSASRPPDGVRSHAWWKMGEAMGASGARVVTLRASGFVAHGLREEQYAIDVYGLNDPLLARLPSFDDGRWKPGHAYRTLPRGYLQTHLEGENRLEDADLREYYELIRTVTRGPLLSAARWRAIVALNSGSAARSVNFERYKHPESRVGFALTRQYATPAEFNDDAPVKTYGDRLHVHVRGSLEGREVHLAARHETPVTLVFLSNTRELGRVESEGERDGEAEVTRHVFTPPVEATGGECDGMMIFTSVTDRRVERTIPEGLEPDTYESIELRAARAGSPGE